MIRECFRTNTGIQFHAPLLRSIGIEPNHLYPYIQPRPEAISFSSLSVGVQSSVLDTVREAAKQPPPPVDTDATVSCGYTGTPLAIGSDGKMVMTLSEEEEDLRDALCPIYDQLSYAPVWWLLELLPMRHREQKEDDSWIGNWS